MNNKVNNMWLSARFGVPVACVPFYFRAFRSSRSGRPAGQKSSQQMIRFMSYGCAGQRDENASSDERRATNNGWKSNSESGTKWIVSYCVVRFLSSDLTPNDPISSEAFNINRLELHGYECARVSSLCIRSDSVVRPFRCDYSCLLFHIIFA